MTTFTSSKGQRVIEIFQCTRIKTPRFFTMDWLTPPQRKQHVFYPGTKIVLEPLSFQVPKQVIISRNTEAEEAVLKALRTRSIPLPPVEDEDVDIFEDAGRDYHLISDTVVQHQTRIEEPVIVEQHQQDEEEEEEEEALQPLLKWEHDDYFVQDSDEEEEVARPKKKQRSAKPSRR